jgi:hypothetical protein
MKIIVRPIAEPECEIDMTHRLVAAIAEELWRLYGGNEHLNWIEAERHLERIVADARREAKETDFLVLDAPRAEPPPARARASLRRAWRRGRPDARAPANV